MNKASNKFLRRVNGYFFRTVRIEKLAYVLDIPEPEDRSGAFIKAMDICIRGKSRTSIMEKL